jgi:lambda repressor-like predicted transcriptional regulator
MRKTPKITRISTGRTARGGALSGPMSDRHYEATIRAFRAISRMRHDGLSLLQAAREEGTTPATVRNRLPATLRFKKGRWVVTKSDRYVRLLSLPGPHGPVTVRARGSEEARFASAYLASIARWARTEKPYELAPFHGKNIGDFELITASRTLRALSDAGLLQLDSLYTALKETV